MTINDHNIKKSEPQAQIFREDPLVLGISGAEVASWAEPDWDVY
jgi:hypothetical protein